MKLYTNTPRLIDEDPTITAYIPEHKSSDCAVIIFPGGAYVGRAAHEGKGYCEFLNENGITAFDVAYRVSPNRFPSPLLDARRAVRLVRSMAEQYGIAKNKIAVMGSSAGGHLAATVSTYTAPLEGEYTDSIDTEDFLPNAQILCYPVIANPLDFSFSHKGSYKNLLGSNADDELIRSLDPLRNVTDSTPPAFIWHTSQDTGVPPENSLRYASELISHKISTELHLFPEGPHGLGLAPSIPHTAQWGELLVNWLNHVF